MIACDRLLCSPNDIGEILFSLLQQEEGGIANDTNMEDRGQLG